MEVAHFCKEFADQGVVGIDIAGAARKNGPHNIDHVKAFDVSVHLLRVCYSGCFFHPVIYLAIIKKSVLGIYSWPLILGLKPSH